jgi:NAD(P)-dependent dehydrogenase (short-subunit alcohol dehydrogenase family)
MQLNSSISAIITGGASGLGQATCAMLRAQGVKVALFDRDPRGAEIAARHGALFFETDVTLESAIAASLAQARAAQGTERIVVNCAGIVIGKRTVSKKRDSQDFIPHDQTAFATVIGVNLIGSFLMGAQCAAAMAQLDPVTPDGGRGVIINTASIAAEDGQMGQAAYAASKGGVVGMTLPMARDLAQYGIRVVSIMPGLFETPMLASLPDDIRHSLEAQIPFPARLGLPEEYAKLVKSIIDNDMLNGTSIRLDGALRMQPK